MRENCSKKADKHIGNLEKILIKMGTSDYFASVVQGILLSQLKTVLAKVEGLFSFIKDILLNPI